MDFQISVKMSNILTLTQRLDALLREYNPVNYHKLQPPLPDDEIKSYLQKIGIDDENIFTFYKWKNGVSPDEETRAMLFDFKLYSLSLENVLKYKKLYADDFDEDHIMLFASPFDTMFLFNMNCGEDYGKLHIHSVPLLSIEDPYSYYDTVETMLATNIRIYESGGFFYDVER